MKPSLPPVAVVGLGAMGERIAARLLDAGYAVRVWNRTRAKAKMLVARGATAVPSPAAAASEAEFVITMVADATALREVTEGATGVAAGIGPETVLVQMATLGRAAIACLASSLPRQTQLLDAPVLGSVGEAEAGTLIIFVGGDNAVVARTTPLLATLGRPLHVGALGAATAAKLVANSALFSVLTALGEAIALADATGLDREATYAVLATTPLAAQAERRRPAIEARDYRPRFKLALARKDAELIVDEATAAGIELRVADAVRSWLTAAVHGGRSDDDYTALLTQIAPGDDTSPPLSQSVEGERT